MFRNRTKRLPATLPGIFTFWAVIASLAAGPLWAAEPARYEASHRAMGSLFHIAIYANDDAQAKTALTAAMERIDAVNASLSDYDPDSELSRLSAAAPTALPVDVGDDLWRVMRAAERVSRESDGAFDVTVGPLTTLWRAARKTKTMPDDEMLRQALASVGHSLVELSSDRQAIALKRGGMRLDLGGIAKGYAVDEALAVLRKHGVERALVNGGGDIGASGAPPGKSGWTIGVAPLEPQAEPSMLLSLKDAAVATSGDAWQFVEIAGRRYSHIVDPHTGLGLSQRSSVTVTAPNCTAADAYASAISVLGPENGVRLADRLDGVECLSLTVVDGKLVQAKSRGFDKLPRSPK